MHPREFKYFDPKHASVFIKDGKFELIIPNGSLLPIADEINIFDSGGSNTATIKLPVNIVQDDKDALYRYMNCDPKTNMTPIQKFVLEASAMIDCVEGKFSKEILESIAEKLLQIEKEHIEKAFNAQYLHSYTDAVDYYNKTYGGKQDN